MKTKILVKRRGKPKQEKRKNRLPGLQANLESTVCQTGEPTTNALDSPDRSNPKERKKKKGQL